ncbi:MAG: hypothetical protein ACQEXX_02020 [Bacillota bacterium]
MAVTQEIGIPIDLSTGRYMNTVFKDDSLQLIEVAKDDNGNSVFTETGTWESEPIRIKDKVTSIKRVSKNVFIKGNGSFKIYTCSSPDQYEWSVWEEIDYTDGSIKSPVSNYAKIKIEIFANRVNSTFTIDDFDTQDKYNNGYINSSDGKLELKKYYILNGIQNTAWADIGKVFSTTIHKTNYKRVDKIEVDL